jgi:hypothetical protein
MIWLTLALFSCTQPDEGGPVDNGVVDTAVALPDGVSLTDGPIVTPDKRMTIELKEAAGLWAACAMDGDEREIILVESLEPATTHELKLLGLAAGETYTCTVTVDTGEVLEVPVEVKLIPTAPLFTVERDTSLPFQGAWTLFNDADGCFSGSRAHAIVVDPEGRHRWVYEVGSNYVVDLDIMLTPEGNVHIGGGWGILDTSQPNRGVFRDVDFEGNILLEREEPDFGIGWNHHSEAMEDGTYMSLTTHVLDDGNDAWYGVAIERWHPTDGVRWSWDTTDMLNQGQLWFIPGDYAPYHANSVTWATDTAGDALYVSLYSAKQIWRIDRNTGLRTWTLGAGGDFTLVDTEGDALADQEWFYVQHDPEYTADGRVLVYDNGYERPGTDYSRLAEYQLDTDKMEATLLWTWTEDNWSNPVIGDADYLANGHVLATRGFMRCWSPNSSDVSQLNEVDPVTGKVAWRMSWPNNDRAVFRSERYNGCDMFANNTRFCPAAKDRLNELTAR